MNIFNFFLTQQGNKIIKSAHYFIIYEKHFRRYVNRPVLMFEIGTGEGGSSNMWKNYFGPLARIVTVDIRDCSAVAQSQVFTRQGSQSDPAFLQGLVQEFGQPDIVLDDGSHMMPDVNATFDVLFPALQRDGVYLVEDLNTAYWPANGGGLRAPGSFIERCKGLVDELNAPSSNCMAPTDFSQTAFSITFYDLVVVIEKTPYVNRELLFLPDPGTGSASDER